jgi:hypothetical protein
MRAVVGVVVVAFGALFAAACDEMNRPMAVPQSAPRRGCFSDVECASSMKCVKGPNDVQGICEGRTGADDGGAAAGGPGGQGAEDGGNAPAVPMTPPHAPAPGDVQL